MKEAIIVGLDGKYQEPTIVPDEQSGVTPIYAAPTPQEDDAQAAGQEPEATGYIIAEKVPEGLYLPRWDFANSGWVESLTPEEIDVIKNAPQPVTVDQRVSDLEALNATLMMDSANKDIQISQQNEMIADLMMTVAQLQSGGAV